MAGETIGFNAADMGLTFSAVDASTRFSSFARRTKWNGPVSVSVLVR